jgi:hypothetical protein
MNIRIEREFTLPRCITNQHQRRKLSMTDVCTKQTRTLIHLEKSIESSSKILIVEFFLTVMAQSASYFNIVAASRSARMINYE